MATVKRAEEIAGKKVGYLLDTKVLKSRTELFEGEAKEYSRLVNVSALPKQGIKSTREVIALNVAGALDIFLMMLKLVTKYWLMMVNWPSRCRKRRRKNVNLLLKLKTMVLSSLNKKV